MDKISNVRIQSILESTYFKPFTIQFTQNDNKKSWDLLTVKDSVAIILYNVTRKVLIMVKQFRPAVYVRNIPEEDRKVGCEIDMKQYPPEIGITLELCAGTVDKKLCLAEIAKEEVLEECGYNVPLSNLQQITITCQAGVGTSACLQTTFYCEVTDEMKISSGGGVEDELIDVVEMTVDDVKKYIAQGRIKSPPGFLFSIYWFLYHKGK